MSNIARKNSINFDAKYTAFPYQAEAFQAIKDMKYSAIFHEQGLGKTKIAIDLSLYWLQFKGIDTVLIVTKKQLVKNWQDELRNHTYLKPKTLDNDKGNNFRVFNSPAKIIITNFETIVSEQDRLTLFLKARSVAIIIDESTKLKNPSANITKTFFGLRELFKIKTIMTGTPVANRPYDIWSQIYFLDGGDALGDNFEEFKRATNLTNNLEDDLEAQENFENSVGSIFQKIKTFSIRETKKSCAIDLPEKRYQTVYADYEKKQLIAYRNIKTNLQLEINKDGKQILDDESESLKRLLRLNQMASNPKLIDELYDQMSGKELVLDALINEIMRRNEKCIIWSCFIGNIEQFADKYSAYKARKIHGGMSIQERNRSVELFKNNPDCKLLFATPQAAKEGQIGRASCRERV